MKKIFYILGLFLLLIPFKVNAETLTLNQNSLSSWSYYPEPDIFHDYGTHPNYHHIWQDGNDYYVRFIAKHDLDYATRLGWNLGTYSLCNGDNVILEGKMTVNYPLDGISVTTDGSCSYTLGSNQNDVFFTCTYKNIQNKKLAINLEGLNFFGITDYQKDLNFGISRQLTYTCNPSNEKVIQNQNNNTQTIIDNQNHNKNEIINNQNQNSQNEINNANQNHEEAQETRKGILGKIGDLLSSIIELPGKLVSLLIDGLKSLFVPTDEQLYEIVNDSKDLSENFGFVGESMNFFITIFTSLLGMVNANGCVEFPEFTIGATSLTPSITFWTAHNVCLNDNPILSSNITTIRTITSIVLVALFINFAASKFFSILNKNDSGTTYDVASDGTATVTDWTRTNGVTTRVRR